MRPDQIFDQRKGPHTNEVTINSADIFSGITEEDIQNIVASAVAKVLITTKEQLKSRGVYVDFKQV